MGGGGGRSKHSCFHFPCEKRRERKRGKYFNFAKISFEYVYYKNISYEDF